MCVCVCVLSCVMCAVGVKGFSSDVVCSAGPLEQLPFTMRCLL